MIVENESIVNRETAFIAPEYVNGLLCSKVLVGNELILANHSPKKTIDSGLLYFGSDLNGAIRSAKKILGNISMPPIVISTELDMYFFPTLSPENKDCIWLSLAHIKALEEDDRKSTKVHLLSGYSILVDISKARLEMKMQRAIKLKYLMNERTKKKMNFFYVPKKSITLCRELEDLNYRMKHSDEH